MAKCLLLPLLFSMTEGFNQSNKPGKSNEVIEIRNKGPKTKCISMQNNHV